MKQKKKISVLLVIVLLIGMLTGCTSAEKVLNEMSEVMADKTLTGVSFEMPFIMGMTIDEDTVDVDLDLSGTFNMSDDPIGVYGEIKYEGNVMDQWLSDKMELYCTKEGETYVMYLYSKLTDSWYRSDTGMIDADFKTYYIEQTSSDSSDYDSELLVLAEETQMINGSEVYVVSYTFSGQLIQDAINEMGGFGGVIEKGLAESTDVAQVEGLDLSALDNLDFSALSMPVTMYVDKSSYILVQMDMEYIGMQDLMNQMVEVIVQMAEETAGEDASELGLEDKISFEIPNISIKLTDLCYDPVEIKRVPEEGVILGKQAAFVPAQEDGSYVIQEYGEAVRIVPVAGQEMTYVEYNTLETASADGYAYTAYSMLGSDYVETDITDYVASSVDDFTQQGLTVTTEDTVLGDYTVRVLSCEGIKFYYAWRQAGDGWLMVETYNLNDTSIENVLQPVLDTVSEYTLP